MPTSHATPSLSTEFLIKDFSILCSQERQAVAQQVARLERKVFPSNESFDYNVELKKKNIGLILAFKEDDPAQIVGYLVYQRMKRLVWLHKLCVTESQRKKGIGRNLVNTMQRQMEKGGGENICLWVDENRAPARALYESCGFQQIEIRPDYYSPGRAGLKMELRIGN